MSPEPKEGESAKFADGTSEAGDKQVLGKQLWRIFPYIKPYWKRFALGITSNMGARICDLLPFVAMGLLTDAILSGEINQLKEFAFYGLLILGSFTGLAIFQGVSNYSWETLAQYLQHDIRIAAFESLIKMEIRYFEDRQTGDIMSVISADVNQLENFLSDASTSMIRIVITFTTAFAILVWMSWKLALILFVPIIFIMPLIYFFSTRVQKKYRESRQSFGDINAVLSNNISGMGVVQAYNAETYEAERVGRESSSYKNHAIGATVQRTKFLPGIYVIAGLAFGLLATAGGYLMLQGQDSGGISPGQFVTFLLMSTRMSMPLFILGMLVNQIQKSEASARRVFAMVDLEPSIVDKENADALLKPADSISFNDVHFGYPNGNKVLNGVSFDLKRNQSVGIVGPTGAGKSTIVKLLLRYYETDNGIISMNDKDINDLKLGSIREQIGYVSQDVYLFHGTIRENIAYADQSAGNEAIENAASLAGANDFIESFPKGYDTIVGDRGVKLSGGQRQRISLARAILRQPPLLILDEATSAVDTRTEEIIQRNLNQFKDGRMTVAVAHRLSTIRDADQIIVLVDGVVVERGAHDDLISQQGVYADLWAVQTGELDNTTGEATQHDG
ncbi:MAG TPA: ABC transporter ATP-binding protein [Candidatus Thalassarchaeaceae archaeon]|nr:ABC transporter ATP-binding protein [Candidatus Thalassarchaeaceae archaeon]